MLVALIPLLMITGILDFFEDRNRKKVELASVPNFVAWSLLASFMMLTLLCQRGT